jgi:hypothetical protein
VRFVDTNVHHSGHSSDANTRTSRESRKMQRVARRCLTVEAKAVRYHKHGHPTNVLK